MTEIRDLQAIGKWVGVDSSLVVNLSQLELGLLRRLNLGFVSIVRKMGLIVWLPCREGTDLMLLQLRRMGLSATGAV